MDVAQLDSKHRNERVLQRRAARARRSKWLGRLLFSLTGMGLLLMLRMNPTIVGEVVAYAHMPDRSSVQGIANPGDVRVQVMPGDSVPVRRGGDLAAPTRHNPQTDSQTQADAVRTQLKNMSIDG